MPYVPPSQFLEVREYAKNYLPHYVVPLDLTFRSMLRGFETGMLREKRRARVVPKKIYPMNSSSSTIEFKGKRGIMRKVEVPYSKESMISWYEEEAKNYKKESYRQWLANKWGIGSQDGRRTGAINFLVIYGEDMTSQIHILARTGHKSLEEITPYVREYATVGGMLSAEDRKIIKVLMSHISLAENHRKDGGDD
jgi:hypothetical protein